MQNYVQEGTVLTVIAPAAVKSGDLVQTGVIVGVAACDAEVGDRLELRVEGVFEVPKLAPSDVLAAGSIAKGTFTAGVGKVGAAGTNNIGWITEASGAGAATAKVRLIPSTAAVTATAAAEESQKRKPG